MEPLKGILDFTARRGATDLTRRDVLRYGMLVEKEEVEAPLRQLLGVQPLVNDNHDLRMAFFTMADYNRRLRERYSEAEWQEQRDLALHPVLCRWRGGFSILEKDGDKDWRWCNARGELVLLNHSQSPRTVTLEMTCASSTPVPAKLSIRGAGVAMECTIEIDMEGEPISLTLDVAPGTQALTFECKGRVLSYPGDSRDLVFRVKNFTLSGPRPDGALAHRHRQGVQHHVLIGLRTHGPADHAAGAQIQEHGEVEPARAGGDGGQIADPDPVQGTRAEALLQQVRRRRGELMVLHDHPKPSASPCFEARQPPQPRNAMPPTRDADLLQRVPQLDRPILFPRLPMQAQHVGMLDPVLSRHLPHHQLRVREDAHPARSPREGVAQGVQQGLVLRHVVAGPAEVTVERRDLFARGGRDVHPEARLAGVAPAGPVDVEVEVLPRGAQGSALTVGGGAS